MSEHFRNYHTLIGGKTKYYIFQMQTVTIRMWSVRCRGDVLKAEIRLALHFLFSIRFISPRRKLFYLRSSFHHEQS